MVSRVKLHARDTIRLMQTPDSSTIMRPLGISVVIPTLDRLELLTRAYDSVSCTQPAKVEILVIDDGSPCDLRPHLPLQNRHGVAIRSYRFDRNRGPQAARNLGVRRARFSHIAFLDSDDAFTPDKLDVVLEKLDVSPPSSAPDLLFHGVQGMPKYGQLGRLWTRHLSAWLPFSWWVALLNPVVTPALVIRREHRLGVPWMRHCEDWAFLLRYVRVDTRVLYLDHELSIVFRAQGSQGGLSSATWGMRRGEFTARRILLSGKVAWPSGPLRYAAGATAGLLRILNDLLRCRYLR